MKTLRKGIREKVHGFEEFKAGKSSVSNSFGFFTKLGSKIDPQDPPANLANIYNPTDNHSVYYQIYRNLGKDAADMFVNKRYVAFEKDLKQAFQAQFEELEQDEQTSPQEAKAEIMEQMEVISSSSHCIFLVLRSPLWPKP